MMQSFEDPGEVSRIVDVLADSRRAETDDPAVRVERQAWIAGRNRDDDIPAISLGPRREEPRARSATWEKASTVPGTTPDSNGPRRLPYSSRSGNRTGALPGSPRGDVDVDRQCE